MKLKKKLKKHCPHLFEYPNFVGTIQSFVNKYLAIPYYISTNQEKIYKIDIDKYYNEVDYKLRFKKDEIGYLVNKNKSIFFKSRFRLDENGVHYVSNEMNNEKLNIKAPEKWIKERTADNKINNILSFINDYKIEILKKGILHFDDCYFLAENYSYKYPKIKSILQSRFKFVFVDEMQDLEKFQIDIIENIFAEKNSKTVIQRIGDPNQAIYNSSKKVKIECDWKERKPLFLKGSNRLTKLNSNLVNRFILDSKKDKEGIPKFIVESKGEKGIKPHLIVFSHETKHLLKGKFKDLIIEHNLHNCNKNKEDGFKIIGWSAVWDEIKEDNKNIRLQDIFPEYSKESKAKKEDFSTLSKHIQLFDENKTTLEAVRKSILNALIYILLLENEKYKTIVRGKEVERRYSKSEMIKHIQSLQLEEKHPLSYEVFKEKLFKWCFDLVTKKNYEAVFNSIKQFINTEFREWFGLNDSLQPATKLFILNFEKEVKLVKEIIKEEDISIDIATIHSVKGQTHCATMYIETFKNKYESQKAQIINVLTNKEHNFIVGEKNKGKNAGEKDAFGKEALKMMYVGFSRPTHLLCFAVLAENVKDDLEKYKSADWVINDDLT
ncbi:UvrD-helicase domain-containing protein [Flavobacterium taihuense]|uniref:UvrD-helicase domain-containing protein n=1 Tax=Flavobacterium taihuense TaxID=2857508 RepID=A0ABS6Y0T5_9FLAO|nr:UvrD-helicase domain-containing protein [Flavobacterium taihuense]MBW4362547.1 UvrD-helicase domain-containing protein [Flavobacterium taihuense]